MADKIISPIQREDLGDDKGHEQLVKDLEMLLALALTKKFHDFESSWAMPKKLLVAELEKLISRAKSGWYDN